MTDRRTRGPTRPARERRIDRARCSRCTSGGARDHYDEDLSQLDHALQTAALAVAADASDALVAAALLHDVGHLLELARRRRPDRRACQASRATSPTRRSAPGTSPGCSRRR